MSRRRKAGRHARTSRRFTPRRWLPFVALIALVATSVVVSKQVNPSPDDELVVVSPEILLPVASVDDPISSTWFCGGGTASEPGEGADLSVVIANASDEGARAEVTFFGTEGDPATEMVEVPINDRLRVRANDVLPGEWSAATVEVFGGRPTVERRVEGADGFDQSPCSSAASDTWYLPSGSTLRGAAEHIFLFNPFPDATSVDIAFATDEGPLTPQDLTGIAVAPRSLRVVTVENPARRKEVAATITTRTGRIVVDRLQTFDGTGDEVAGSGATAVATGAPRGISSGPAMATPSPRWFFPDARIALGSRTQLAIFNPSERNADLDLIVGFDEPDRYAEIEPIRISVRAGEQLVFDLTDHVSFSAPMELTLDLRSSEGVKVLAELVWITGERELQELATEPDPSAVEDPPVEDPPVADPTAEGAEGEGEGDGEETIVENKIYGPGLAVTAGSPVGARSWFVAGRGSSTRVTSEIVVANPSGAPVEVTVRELMGGQQSPLPDASVSIPAGGRVTLDLAQAQVTSALIISGKGPLVVGRTLWSIAGRGVSVDLATPFPDQVVPLPVR